MGKANDKPPNDKPHLYYGTKNGETEGLQYGADFIWRKGI